MKSFSKVVSLLILCFLLTAALTGCATTSGRLEPQSVLKLADVPIPAGLNPLPQKSYFFENSGVRVAVLKYQGRANIEQVVTFFKEQMPSYNWSLVNIVEYGQRLLNFERENEACIITVQIAGLWNEDALVTVSLGPKSQALPRKYKQVIK